MLRQRKPITYENALSRAAALCARCEQCTPDIRKKLSTWGLGSADIERLIHRLEELKFIDDVRFAKAYAHDKLHFSGWGRRKIEQGLWAKRLPRDVIECACEDFDNEPDVYRSMALRVMKAKTKSIGEWPLSRESKIKIVKFAMTRGFEYQLVAEILRNNTADLCPTESD